MRTEALRGDKDGLWHVSVPLKYLNLFFTHEMYFPCRSLINVELTLAEDKKLLIVKDGESATERFKLQVKSISLKLAFATFEGKLRERYLNTIDKLSLTRNFQCPKEVVYSLKKGSTMARVESLFNFSQIPSVLLMFFVLESVGNGDRLNNRFTYKNMDVGKIEIFKSSVPHHSNPTTSLMNITQNSYWHYKWYNDFVSTFGSASLDMTPESFFLDSFIYTFNLSPNPLIPGQDQLITERASDRKLSLIEAGALDISLSFNTSLAENTCVHFLSFVDGISEFTADGIIKPYN